MDGTTMTNTPFDANHPLHALTKYDQWIVWMLIQKPGKPKPDKVPVDPVTRRAIDPHVPMNRITAEQAILHEQTSGGEVKAGFVFTDDDPFFFIDLDNVATETGWNDTATYICNLFNGAAIEVSQSGSGLHIFGCGQIPAGFKHKNKSLGLENYQTKRFVALNLSGQPTGNAWTDHSEALRSFIPNYFEAQEAHETEVGWTTEPRAEWNGPADDDELIEKMLSSRGGAAAMFGGKATIQQLWEADPAVLQQFYPDGFGDRAYDASSADAALMAHLAFWTGADCERMKRLAYRSGLVRDKWNVKNHRSYLTDTISKAAARCKAVYGAPHSDKPDHMEEANKPCDLADMNQGGSVASLDARPVRGSTVMTADEQVAYFQGCVYVTDRHAIFTPKGSFLKPEQFNAAYGGFEFLRNIDGAKTDKPFDVFTRSTVMRFPKADRICFRPELGGATLFEEEGFVYLNTYVPARVVRREGDATPFVEHMKRLLPDDRDREIMLSYAAAIVQYPGVKFQWCPVVQGVEGNGKSLIAYCLEYAVGTRYTHMLNAGELSGNGTKFNAWIENKLFASIDEIHTRDKYDVIEALKPIITNRRLEIQGKGRDQYTGDNRANFYMTSNHRDAIAKTRNDRRYAVFYTAQQTRDDLTRDGMRNTPYFPDLYGWLDSGGFAIVAHYLANYPIAAEFNPAGQCQQAPDTSVSEQVIEESRGTAEQEILEQIEQGRPGMSKGWISSVALDHMLQEVGFGRRIPRNKRKEVLSELGYVPHPALHNGRCTTRIHETIDGRTVTGRPVLYVKKDSIQHNITDPSAVQDAYAKAQGWPGANDVVDHGAMG